MKKNYIKKINILRFSFWILCITTVFTLNSCKKNDIKESEKQIETTAAKKELTIEETIKILLLEKDVDVDTFSNLSTNFKENYKLNPIDKSYLKDSFVDDRGFTHQYSYEVIFENNDLDQNELVIDCYKKILDKNLTTNPRFDKNTKSIYFKYSLNKRNKLETLTYVDEDLYYDEDFRCVIDGVKFNERNFAYILASLCHGEDYYKNYFYYWETGYFLNYRTTTHYKDKFGLRKSIINKELFEKIVNDYENKVKSGDESAKIDEVLIDTTSLIYSKIPEKRPEDFFKEGLCPVELVHDGKKYHYYIHFNVTDDYYLDDLTVEKAPDKWEYDVEEEEEYASQDLAYNEEKKTELKKVNVNFKIGTKEENKNDEIIESDIYKNGNHSNKYYSYIANFDSKKDVLNAGEMVYRDVRGNERRLVIDNKVKKTDVIWGEKGVKDFFMPLNKNISYGIDISYHNGNVDFNKVKNAGFDFVIVRIVYRGYGSKGTLLIDNKAEENIINAKNAGLKVGAYVFSQAIDKNEAMEEGMKVVEVLNSDTLKNVKLDLPIFFDPETIRNDVARTDDIKKETFTENALTFMNYIKDKGYEASFYSNMVWEDYYFDMSKLNGFNVWYADYEDFPQTPYDYKYWQFSELGLVDGVKGFVDLNIMIK